MVHEDQPEDGVPDGAAVFPLIPPELGVDPLLLATLHAVVFLVGSDAEAVNEAAAEEALQYVMSYLQRLDGPRLRKVREDVQVLLDFAKQDDWPKQDVHFLKSFLSELGAGGPTE